LSSKRGAIEILQSVIRRGGLGQGSEGQARLAFFLGKNPAIGLEGVANHDTDDMLRNISAIERANAEALLTCADRQKLKQHVFENCSNDTEISSAARRSNEDGND
jgi:hypothetical protein